MDSIIVLDGQVLNPGDLSWEPLKKMGTLTVWERTPPDLVAKRIGTATAIFVNKTVIDQKVMEQCPNLKYIGVLATGYDVVDILAAKSKNITVTNIPSYGTAAVSQFAFALLLEICHHIGHHSEAVHQGRWQKSPDWAFWDYPLIELYGKTMGIIGFGRIGQATGRIAQAFGLSVLATDENPARTGDENATYVSLDELLAKSDIISLHCPMTPGTRGLINQKTISKMKDGVILINTSRGLLIIEEDLASALKSGKIRAAALDVVSKEPIEENNPLFSAPNLILTPHIAGAPLESRQRLLDTAIQNYRQFISGKFQNVVNP